MGSGLAICFKMNTEQWPLTHVNIHDTRLIKQYFQLQKQNARHFILLDECQKFAGSKF
jgi:hypothetical protein